MKSKILRIFLKVDFYLQTKAIWNKWCRNTGKTWNNSTDLKIHTYKYYKFYSLERPKLWFGNDRKENKLYTSHNLPTKSKTDFSFPLFLHTRKMIRKMILLGLGVDEFKSLTVISEDTSWASQQLQGNV